MELKNLSKVKYIYRIYESDNEVLHIERYPVIYINSKVVYFKTASKQEYLECKKITEVSDDFVHFYQKIYTYWPLYSRVSFDEYFWNVETNVNKIYQDLIQQRYKMRHETDLERKRKKAEQAKREYEAALKEIEILEQIGKTLREETE